MGGIALAAEGIFRDWQRFGAIFNVTVSRIYSHSFLIAAGLLLTFAPLILVSYAKHDDYLFSLLATSDPPGLYFSQAYNGRLLNGVLLYLILPWAKTIDSYRYIRIIGLAGMIWLALRLYTEFQRRRATRATAPWLAYAICVMPAGAFYLGVTANTFYLLATSLAAEAGCIAWYVVCQSTWRRSYLLFLGCVCLFIVAGLIYESAAMVYWVVVAAFILAHQQTSKTLVRRFAGLLVIAGLGSLGILIAHALSGANEHEHAALTNDIVSKFLWFLGVPMQDALNLFVVPSAPQVAIVTGLTIFVGVWLNLRGTIGQRLLHLGVLLALLPLSFLPHIVAAHHWATYLTEIALTSIVILYGWFAVRGYARTMRPVVRRIAKYLPLIAVPIFAVFAGFTAARNALINVAIPDLIEFRYVKSQILDAELAGIDTIYIVRPHWEDSLAAEVEPDFGAMTSYWDWGAIPITRAALHAVGQDDSRFSIESFPAGEQIKSSANTLVIDMTGISNDR